MLSVRSSDIFQTLNPQPDVNEDERRSNTSIRIRKGISGRFETGTVIVAKIAVNVVDFQLSFAIPSAIHTLFGDTTIRKA